jgi:hypothetical protein
MCGGLPGVSQSCRHKFAIYLPHDLTHIGVYGKPGIEEFTFVILTMIIL